MSGCLPCIKKIINEGAATAVSCLASVSGEIPERVKSERLSVADAEAFLKDVIELEKDFVAKASKLMDDVNAKTLNPWWESGGV